MNEVLTHKQESKLSQAIDLHKRKGEDVIHNDRE